MKTIGLIGGMSCESTRLYYDAINALARERLGGLHSAEMLIWSVDFAPIAQMQADGDWDGAGARLAHIARKLQDAGADIILLATNTMHLTAPQITANISAPFLHIAEATAEAIRARGLQRPALIATAFTMEQSFYTDRLKAHGLETVIPNEEERAEIHKIIYEELCKGEIKDDSRAAYERIVKDLVGRGADCVILGCTEVGLLLNEGNTPAPVFDTTLIHAKAAIDAALS